MTALEAYIEDILKRSRAMANDLEEMMESLGATPVHPPVQFNKPPIHSVTPPETEISPAVNTVMDTSIDISVGSLSSFIYSGAKPPIPSEPSSTCHRRPSNIRAHRMLAPPAQHASFALDDEDEDFNDDEDNPSSISFLQPQNQSPAHRLESSGCIDITSSIENLPEFHHKKYVDSDYSEKLSTRDPAIPSTETPGFRRERLLLEIMRNYGDEFK